MKQLARLTAKRDRMIFRAGIISAVRQYFLEEGFLEVSTPLLNPSVIPEEHIDIIQSEVGFLMPSPEICMKPLLAAGYGNIFQISPAFRKGEKGDHHLPEFTLLEWYRTEVDYHALAQDCERLFQRICMDLFQQETITYQGIGIDLTVPWPRVDVSEAFQRLAGWDPAKEKLPEKFEMDLVEKVVPGLTSGKPFFLIDFPHYEASLARKKANDPLKAERLELFAGGLELANGFSELTDPGEQRRRFELVNQVREQRGVSPYPMPVRFLDSLEHMPPSAGMALGMDRLVMLLTDAARIDEVVL